MAYKNFYLHNLLMLALASSSMAAFAGSPAESVAKVKADKNIKERSDDDEAGEAWKHCIPQNAVSKHGLPEGQLVFLLRKNQVSQIRALLKSAPVHSGDQEERQMWLAACLSQEQRYDEAVAIFDQIKTLEQAPVLVVLKAAKAYSDDQRFDKSIKLCSAVIAKWPAVEAYKIRAGSYSALDRLSEAADDYVKLAQLKKSSAKTYYVYAGNLLVKAGRSKEALALMDKAALARGGERDAAMLLVRANCYKNMGQWQKAIDVLTAVEKSVNVDRGPSHKNKDGYYRSVCLKERALCYEKLGKHALAQADLKALNDSSRAIEDELIGD
ncbi:MAG: tetratricopeptide repeat protein [Candidatus Obscuribacter sp.]|nr:tetratricopeptide repeat protein [Candidatus Obscuribacter sp.]